MTHLNSTLKKKTEQETLKATAIVARVSLAQTLFYCCIAIFFCSCRAEYETVVQDQVVTDVIQNSKGTYRIKARTLTSSRPLRKTKISPGDTLQCMVLRRIK